MTRPHLGKPGAGDRSADRKLSGEPPAPKEKEASDSGVAPVITWNTWKTIIEFSSVATLLSFLVSAGTIYSVLESNGVRFSAVVGVNDVVVYGVWQLISTVSWMVYILPLVIAAYIIISFYMLLIDTWFTDGNKRHRWIFIFLEILAIALIVVPAFYISSIGQSNETAWEGWLFGTNVPYFRVVNSVGLPSLYAYMLSLGAVYTVFSAYLVRTGVVKSDKPRRKRSLSRILLTFRMIGASFLFAISVPLAGYAAYSKLNSDFSRGIAILDDSLRNPSCPKTEQALVVWIGESSLIVRCGDSVTVIKGSENVRVVLRRSTVAS